MSVALEGSIFSASYQPQSPSVHDDHFWRDPVPFSHSTSIERTHRTSAETMRRRTGGGVCLGSSAVCRHRGRGAVHVDPLAGRRVDAGSAWPHAGAAGSCLLSKGRQAEAGVPLGPPLRPGQSCCQGTGPGPRCATAAAEATECERPLALAQTGPLAGTSAPPAPSRAAGGRAEGRGGAHCAARRSCHSPAPRAPATGGPPILPLAPTAPRSHAVSGQPCRGAARLHTSTMAPGRQCCPQGGPDGGVVEAAHGF
mmetsp:Transcript_138485/g.386309  ORF Transcript_138485/g.386309 Transcript_138485/m.386309 type:complete len:254 (-) Transcript_138485:17-778(-)